MVRPFFMDPADLVVAWEKAAKANPDMPKRPDVKVTCASLFFVCCSRLCLCYCRAFPFVVCLGLLHTLLYVGCMCSYIFIIPCTNSCFFSRVCFCVICSVVLGGEGGGGLVYAYGGRAWS